MNRKEHWDSIYRAKRDDELSWTQAEPTLSLEMIREVCEFGRVIDVGGGTSVLAKRLLDLEYTVAVLDVSEAALERDRQRLESRAEDVQWIAADVTVEPDVGTFDVWHDRAVFHFLTERADRMAYIKLMTRTVPVGGHAVIGTFALDGPAECSGLEVRRYNGFGLAFEIGPQFNLLKSRPDVHVTPQGKGQSFQFSLFKCI
jgi:SAM-dependent methyltransferase